MNVLLTGATGFLGKHLARAFLDRNYQVSAYYRRDAVRWEGPQWFKTGIGEDDRPFREAGPVDAIVHLATCYGRKGEPIFSTGTTNPPLNRCRGGWRRDQTHPLC